MNRENFFRTSAVIITVGIWILSLIPLSGGMAAIPGTDKIHHALAYFACMIAWGLVMREATPRLKIALLLIAMGVAIECAQGLTTYRTFDGWDMVANAVGVTLGWLFVTFFLALARKYPALSALWRG